MGRNDSPLQQARTVSFLSRAPIVAGRGCNMRSRLSRCCTTIVLATLFAIGASWDLSWAIAPQYQESTDDAYVSGNIVQVTSEIAGTVVFIGCDRNQFVRVGQLVVELDDADARIAVERGKVNLSNHPDVRAAADQLHAAHLHLARTKLPASVSGFVATCTDELGQRVSPGQPLMAIVPLKELWVDANFKERQLAAIRVGQPATLKARLYGGDVTYHGTVASLGAGTVSFGLPPSENATGDHIKVAQPVPVCIALDSRELVERPLQIGLPITVEVDTPQQNDARPLDPCDGSANLGYATLCHPNFEPPQLNGG
jgi:multidrug resistance efflux pump